MYLKYDNMHTNKIFNALICINNHVNLCINCMLSLIDLINHQVEGVMEDNMEGVPFILVDAPESINQDKLKQEKHVYSKWTLKMRSTIHILFG